MGFLYATPVILVLLSVFLSEKKRKRLLAVQKVSAKRRDPEKSEKEKAAMTEMLKRFIGKECIIYMFSDAQYTGVIREISDGCVLISPAESGKEDEVEIINADYISRVREYPRNKKGKKKALVVD